VAAGLTDAALSGGTGAVRIMLFVGGPTTEGPGQVVAKELLEPIRSHKVSGCGSLCPGDLSSWHVGMRAGGHAQADYCASELHDETADEPGWSRIARRAAALCNGIQSLLLTKVAQCWAVGPLSSCGSSSEVVQRGRVQFLRGCRLIATKLALLPLHRT